MQFPHRTNRCTSKNRRISTIRFQHLKYTQGNCMRNCRTTEEPGRGAGFGRLVGPRRGTRGRRHNPAPNKFRMQFPHDTNRRTLKNRRISTIRFQHLKYTQGNCMRNCRTTEEPGRGAGFGRLVGPRRGTRGRRHNPAPNKFRMQFPHDTNRRTLKNRRISTIRFQHLKYTQGNCMRNCRTTEEPGRGARGWRQGLAGHRADAPSEARVWRSRGRAAAHGHTKQPGPTGTPSSPAQRAARPNGQPGPTGGPPPTSTPGPTGVEGAGGTGGHGRASRRGTERSEDA